VIAATTLTVGVLLAMAIHSRVSRGTAGGVWGLCDDCGEHVCVCVYVGMALRMYAG
jgi:hypothetical protein